MLVQYRQEQRLKDLCFFSCGGPHHQANICLDSFSATILISEYYDIFTK